jgi:hypothetical protein
MGLTHLSIEISNPAQPSRRARRKMLVDSGADLQLTRSLIGAGCPLHLALRIVV